jgi:hypothetical protein
MTSVGAYLIGDTDIYVMMQAVFTFGAIFFLRQATEEK